MMPKPRWLIHEVLRSTRYNYAIPKYREKESYILQIVSQGRLVVNMHDAESLDDIIRAAKKGVSVEGQHYIDTLYPVNALEKAMLDDMICMAVLITHHLKPNDLYKLGYDYKDAEQFYRVIQKISEWKLEFEEDGE